MKNRALSPISTTFLFLLLFSSISIADQNNGLVGWWKFDDNSGTTATDSSTPFSGTTNNGTLTNSPTWVTGHNGYALSFISASSQYVNLGSGAVINLSGSPMSISAWIKRANSDAGGTAYDILAGSTNGYIFYFKQNKLMFGKQNVSDDIISTSTVTDTTNWHYVTVTYSGTTANLYIDGILDNTGTVTKSFSTGLIYEIGGSTGASEYFNGSIDDVRIYNRALTAGEVYDLYSSGSLINWWKMDDNASNTTVTDSAGINNGTASVNTSTLTATGKIGKAFTLDGSSQYIMAGTNLITGSSAFTMAGWLKQSGTMSTYGSALNMGVATSGNSAWIGWCASAQVGTSNSIGAGLYATNYGSGITDTKWHHVVLTYSGGTNGTLILYVDSVNKASGTVTPNLSSGSINMGKFATGTAYWYGGTIDDERIYDRALTPAEVRQLYTNDQAEFGSM